MSEQAAYFDSVAERWDDMVRHDPGKVQKIVALLDLRDGMRVLDVGCGTGILTRFLHDAARVETLGLDVSRGMARRAAAKHRDVPGAAFLCGDALDEGLDIGAFDAIVCYSMFPHFADQPAALAALARRLRPGGRLMVAHSQSREAINHLHEEADEPVRRDRLPPMDTLKTWMRAAGLLPGACVDDAGMYVLAGAIPAVVAMTEEYAEAISEWKYDGSYAFYDQRAEHARAYLDGQHFACVDAGGALIGYVCFGEEARIPTVERGVYDEGFVDVGLGLRPDLCGQGLGLPFLLAGLRYARRALGAARFRLSVAAFNERAIKVYERAGFRAERDVVNAHFQNKFLIMKMADPVL